MKKKSVKKIFQSFLLAVIIYLFITALIPPQVKADYGLGCGEGLGPIAKFFCKEVPSGDPNAALKTGNRLNQVISGVIGFMTTVAGLWFIFQFMTAGYQWISSSGDKNKLQTAQNKMTYSIIGLVIVVSAWVVIALLGKILGLDILNPGAVLKYLTI